MIAVSMRDQDIYVLEQCHVHVVEFLERTHRTIDQDQFIVFDKESAVVLVRKSRTPA